MQGDAGRDVMIAYFQQQLLLCGNLTRWLMLSLGLKYFTTGLRWLALVEGEVVKRNVDHKMRIGSETVNFFVLYKNDDDTSKHSST